MDGLGLRGLKLVKVHDPDPSAEKRPDRKRQFEVVPNFVPTCCPSCGADKLYRHGRRVQKYADTPTHGAPAVVLVNRNRWRCTSCSHVFPDPLPDMDERKHATKRLVEYVGKRSMEFTFEAVAREVGLSGPAVRAMFDDMVRKFEEKYRFVTPTVLGIDELKILGSYRCIITNIDRLTVFDILPSRKLDDLRTYFREMPHRERVRFVTADFYAGYATIAREFFPDAKLVIDRFHVQRMGSNAIEAFRKDYRKSLDKKARIDLKNDRFLLLSHATQLDDVKVDKLRDVLQDYPDMVSAWAVKEKFHDIWSARSREEASRLMDEWILCVPTELEKYFKEPLAVLHGRRPEILNYFDHRFTNAYTESVNRLGKTINRMGRGYTLEVVRAKMLYDERAIAKGAVVLRKPRPKPTDDDASMSFMTGMDVASSERADPEARTTYYGAHIPTLCDLLEAGEFE